MTCIWETTLKFYYIWLLGDVGVVVAAFSVVSSAFTVVAGGVITDGVIIKAASAVEGSVCGVTDTVSDGGGPAVTVDDGIIEAGVDVGIKITVDNEEELEFVETISGSEIYRYGILVQNINIYRTDNIN